MNKNKTKKEIINVFEENQKSFEIRNAAIKDMQCNYGYELLTGPNKGDIIPNRKGAHMIHDDLKESFSELDVFLAHIDGAFNAWATNQTPLQDFESESELGLYSVISFKIVGNEENKSVVFSGYKHTNYGVISFDTPRIKFTSSYLYIEELQLRLNKAIEEVELYMNGKKAPEFEQYSFEFDNEESKFENDFDNAKIES